MSFLAKIIILETRMNYLMKAHKLHCHMSHPCKNWRKLNLLLNHLPSSQIPPNPYFLLLFSTVLNFMPSLKFTNLTSFSVLLFQILVLLLTVWPNFLQPYFLPYFRPMPIPLKTPSILPKLFRIFLPLI